MSSILLDQIEEEGLNLPESFRTARQETRQERGGLGSHQAHKGHVDYVKSGQHGHAHISRFRDDEGGPRVLETQLSYEEEFFQYSQRQESDTMLMDS